mgnify:CR=1 FL=1
MADSEVDTMLDGKDEDARSKIADRVGERLSSDEMSQTDRRAAEILARAAKDRLSTDWGLAETGAAGPTGNRYGDAAGHTCIAIDGPVSKVATIETESDDREANMLVFAKEALKLLGKHLEG